VAAIALARMVGQDIVLKDNVGIEEGEIGLAVRFPDAFNPPHHRSCIGQAANGSHLDVGVEDLVSPIERCHSLRFRPSNVRRTTSTFSCDIAYSHSPADWTTGDSRFSADQYVIVPSIVAE
jgi:hypothetical protein